MIYNFQDYNYDNTSEFSLENYITLARVVDIYDGDTCTCIIPIHNTFYKYHVRLCDIDTAELNSKSYLHKQNALRAKKRLFELITDSECSADIVNSRVDLRKILNDKCYIIKLKCGKFEKYGRLLGYLFHESSDCSNIYSSYNYCLINEKLANIYHGGTKT